MDLPPSPNSLSLSLVLIHAQERRERVNFFFLRNRGAASMGGEVKHNRVEKAQITAVT